MIMNKTIKILFTFIAPLVSNDIGSVLLWIANNNNYNEYLFIYAEKLRQV